MAEVCPKCGAPASQSICSKCGLPVDLCACEVLEKEEKKIKVFVERRKFNKPITIIEGVTNRGDEIASQLKQKLACGGTYKKGRIELQGDHRNRLKDLLKSFGFEESRIEIR